MPQRPRFLDTFIHGTTKIGAMLLATQILCACDGVQHVKQSDVQPVITRGPAPAYETVAAGYNARVALLDRLTSPVSVVIQSDKPKGGRSRDQLEGFLSIARPLYVALRLDKVGQTVAYLGSNDFAYWWFDLAGETPVAITGTRLHAAPDDAADFGLPVHPLEFTELVGILSIPATPPANSRVAWSKDGRYVQITVPSRWGLRRLSLDPVSFEPTRIDLLNEKSELAVGALLSQFKPAVVEGSPAAQAIVATRVELAIPGSATNVLLLLADPRVPLKVKPKAFALSQLVEAYGIKKFIDHDTAKQTRTAPTPERTKVLKP